MRVVFSYQQFSGEYGLFGHFARRNSTWAPLAQALLAAICEEAGHEAIILDGQANQWSTERMAQEVVKLNPDIVGINAYSPFFHLSADLAAAIKHINKDIPIMGGGPHFTIVKEKAMLPQFDYGFLGEAEDSLPEFLEIGDMYGFWPGITDNCNSVFEKVRGIMYREGGKIRSTGERWVKMEAMTKKEIHGEHPLDKFPFPARHLLDMRAYRLGTPKGRLHFTSLQTARGCPWRCIFCASDALKTTRYIMKSPKRVVEEMKDVATKYSFTKHIYIVDDVLTFWPEHIVEICDRMDAEGLQFSFESSTRANLVDDKLIKRLAKSGLIRLSFGLETIDPEMRVTMQKKVPIEAYPKANRICTDNGVEAMNSIMIGLPGDTKEKTQKLFDWVSSQRDIKQANLAIAVPYPGTEFHDMAVEGAHGLELLSTDFREYLRYGNAVTNVGDMIAKDLVDAQNAGFVQIYSKPWRWLPVYYKHGTLGFILQMLRVLKLWWKKIRDTAEPFRIHPGLP
jgi:anaerobic magnesium-protoporphyrin IX monomethyl ester cyclase